jgi:uncharacterized protein (DUF983 family)
MTDRPDTPSSAATRAQATVQQERMRAVSFFKALGRGFRRRCPHCGVGSAFSGYLTLTDKCAHCDEKLGHIRADDAPPYFTILIVGHVVVALVLTLEQSMPLSMGVTIALSVSLTLGLMAVTLPIIKGAVVAVMWRLSLSGDEFQ